MSSISQRIAILAKRQAEDYHPAHDVSQPATIAPTLDSVLNEHGYQKSGAMYVHPEKGHLAIKQGSSIVHYNKGSKFRNAFRLSRYLRRIHGA